MSKKPAAKSKTALAANQAAIIPAHTSKRYAPDWADQTTQVISGLRQQQLDLGEGRTADSLQFSLDELTELDRLIIQEEIKLAELRDIRRQKRIDIWQRTTGIRTAVGGLYGKDSLQYQSVGGTRQSERKRPQRKKAGSPQQDE